MNIPSTQILLSLLACVVEAHVGKGAIHYCTLLTVNTGYSSSSHSGFLGRPAAAGRMWKDQYSDHYNEVQKCTATEWTMERQVQMSAGGGCRARMLLPQSDWNTG